MAYTLSLEIKASAPFSLGDPFPAPVGLALPWGAIEVEGDPQGLMGLGAAPAIAAALAGAKDVGPTDEKQRQLALSAAHYRPAVLFTVDVAADSGASVTITSRTELSAFLDEAEAKARAMSGSGEANAVLGEQWELRPVPGYVPPYEWFWTNKLYTQEVQGTAPVAPVDPDPVDPDPADGADLTTIVTIGSQDDYIGFYFSEGSEWDFGHIAEPTFTVDGTRLHFAALEFDGTAYSRSSA